MADVGIQTGEPGTGERTFVARQPILDERHQVFAYELLCRDVGSPAAHGVDDTARTLDAAVLSIGLDELTGGRLAFIRISREALLLLGLHQVRKRASVWAIAGVNGGSPEVVSLTVLRARCCELLGTRMNVADGGAEFFLRGVCSLLDAVTGCPMEEAVRELPLTQDTRDALLGGENVARYVLDAVIMHGRGDWDGATAAATCIACRPRTSPRRITRRCRGRGRSLLPLRAGFRSARSGPVRSGR